MAEIKWIKITTNIFDDEAIKVIEQMPEGDALLVIWLKLLVQAGIINDSGLIYFKKDIPYTEDMLAIVFHKPVTLIRLALTTFVKFGMIEIADNQTILIRNWEKHQNVEGMEQIREYNRLAKQKQRKKEKELKLLHGSQGQCQGHVIECHETDKDIDIDIEKEYIPPPPYIEDDKKNSEEEEKTIILSREEEEILKNYAYSADRTIYDYPSWRKKVIENGNYKSIIEAALQERKQQKEEYTTRPDCQEYIPPKKIVNSVEDEQKIKEIQAKIKQQRKERSL